MGACRGYRGPPIQKQPMPVLERLLQVEYRQLGRGSLRKQCGEGSRRGKTEPVTMPKSHSQLIIGSSEHTFKRVTFRHAQVIRVEEAARALGVAPNSTGGRIVTKNLRQGAFSHQSRGAPSMLRRRTRPLLLFSNRSRVEGDKRIVPENHGEPQEGQRFGGDDQDEAGGNVSTRLCLFGGQHYRK
jgi:hypothetical protein